MTSTTKNELTQTCVINWSERYPDQFHTNPSGCLREDLVHSTNQELLTRSVNEVVDQIAEAATMHDVEAYCMALLMFKETPKRVLHTALDRFLRIGAAEGWNPICHHRWMLSLSHLSPLLYTRKLDYQLRRLNAHAFGGVLKAYDGRGIEAMVTHHNEDPFCVCQASAERMHPDYFLRYFRNLVGVLVGEYQQYGQEFKEDEVGVNLGRATLKLCEEVDVFGQARSTQAANESIA